jgi:hypothetical protein
MGLSLQNIDKIAGQGGGKEMMKTGSEIYFSGKGFIWASSLIQ